MIPAEELFGVFPLGNPIPYTGQVEPVHRGNIPARRTWYHATWEERVGAIARWGLLPSCWFGGDCCCVFGYDTSEGAAASLPNRWIIEVQSRVEADTDLKAWWVPPWCISGAWHQGHFSSRETLLRFPVWDVTARLGQFCCSDGLCVAQYELWRQLVLQEA